MQSKKEGNEKKAKERNNYVQSHEILETFSDRIYRGTYSRPYNI